MEKLLIIGGTNEQKALNRKAQKYAFKLGYRWYGDDDSYKDFRVETPLERIVYCCDCSGLITYCHEDYFTRSAYKEWRVIDISKINNIIMEIE